MRQEASSQVVPKAPRQEASSQEASSQVGALTGFWMKYLPFKDWVVATAVGNTLFIEQSASSMRKLMLAVHTHHAISETLTQLLRLNDNPPAELKKKSQRL